MSLRNHRLCSVRRGKILLRFPWRAASPLMSRKHTTPGESTHTHANMINGVGNWVNFTFLSFLLVWFLVRLTSLPELHPLHHPPALLLFLCPLLRSDPSDINISDEMSKTTVWKSLNSNQKDSRPATTKKARPPPPLFLTPSCGNNTQSRLLWFAKSAKAAAKLCSVGTKFPVCIL